MEPVTGRGFDPWCSKGGLPGCSDALRVKTAAKIGGWRLLQSSPNAIFPSCSKLFGLRKLKTPHPVVSSWGDTWLPSGICFASGDPLLPEGDPFEPAGQSLAVWEFAGSLQIPAAYQKNGFGVVMLGSDRYSKHLLQQRLVTTNNNDNSHSGERKKTGANSSAAASKERRSLAAFQILEHTGMAATLADVGATSEAYGLNWLQAAG
ncbi:hypothetical protein AK812_SmicGene31392 [Symbiodinium microadriaticum]|uniref:Uncharacterized protein n=1 Tax=Symbiodinium microadriaticum TaxID=2951 RepID=A0A1Q9CWX1_SYMMI|nr:hypothetical protein AK812_SmicGene31392 [Symbiodinium microadriaticum]